MENVIVTKSFQFAVRIVKLCRYLRTERKEYTLSDQLLRSGTSIGANVEEAQQGISHADFTFKLTIALKEASESDYWLRLLRASDYLTEAEFSSVYADCKELERLLTSIIKSAKANGEAK